MKNKITFNRMIEVLKKPRYFFSMCYRILITTFYNPKLAFYLDLFINLPEYWIKGELKRTFKLQPPKDRPLHVLISGPSSDETVKYLDMIPGDVLLSNGWVVPYDFLQKYDVKYLCIMDVFLATSAQYLNQFYDKWGKNHNVDIITRGPVYDAWKSKYKNNMKFRNALNIPRNPYNCESIGKGIIKYYKKGYLACAGDGATGPVWAAIQLGYKDIYVHGMDWNHYMNVRCDKENKYTKITKYKHSKLLSEWNKAERLSADNDFITIERAKLSNERDNLKTLYEGIYRSYQQIYNLKYYADAVGAQIYNLSVDSGCDCFEKLDEKDILNKINKSDEMKE